MEVNKYTVFTNKWLTPYNKIVKEEVITFIFSYFNKEHYKVYAHYLEESQKYDDIDKQDASNKLAKNLLYKKETIEYDSKEEVITKSSEYGIISRDTVESLRGQSYIIPNPDLHRLSFLDDHSSILERVDEKVSIVTTSSGEVYKLIEIGGGIFKIECDVPFTTEPEFELKVVTTLNGNII